MDSDFVSKKRLVLVFVAVIALLFVMDIIPKKPINISGAASGSIIMCINRQPEINASCSTSATTTISYNCTVNGSSRDLDQTKST